MGMYPYPCPTLAHISSVMSHTSVRELAIAESSIPSVNEVVVDGEGMRLGRPLVRVSALTLMIGRQDGHLALKYHISLILNGSVLEQVEAKDPRRNSH